jgi:hypothetical protein
MICSTNFYSNVGVRQVENLSPVLFSLFLNDLVEFISHAYDGLTNVYNATHIFLDTEGISVYLKLYLLLYADDTIILVHFFKILYIAFLPWRLTNLDWFYRKNR